MLELSSIFFYLRNSKYYSRFFGTKPAQNHPVCFVRTLIINIKKRNATSSVVASSNQLTVGSPYCKDTYYHSYDQCHEEYVIDIVAVGSCGVGDVASIGAVVALNT